MSLETLHSDGLDDTPIGRLRVVDWFGNAAVAVVDPHDDSRVVRVLHMLKPNENPLAAIYGKRTMESAPVLSAYHAAVESRTNSAESHKRDVSRDFIIEVQRFMAKYEDGREAVAVRLARPGT